MKALIIGGAWLRRQLSDQTSCRGSEVGSICNKDVPGRYEG